MPIYDPNVYALDSAVTSAKKVLYFDGLSVSRIT